MGRRPRDLDPSLGAAFTVGEAVAAGTPLERLRRQDLRSPTTGARVRADASPDEVLAAVLRTMSGTLAFGPSAARVHRLALPSTTRIDPELVYVAVRHPSRAPRRSGVRAVSVHLDDMHVARTRGLPVTTPARTWIDLARYLPLDELVAIGDAMVRSQAQGCGLEDLRTALYATTRVRGAPLLRWALELIDPRAESRPESKIRVAVINAGLPTPLANAVIRWQGRFVARVDLLFPEHRVIIEYEGAHHVTDPAQWRRDLTRIGELQRLGYHVERATADDLRDPSALLRRVRTQLLRRGWSPQSVTFRPHSPRNGER